jgi:hypothetical protein
VLPPTAPRVVSTARDAPAARVVAPAWAACTRGLRSTSFPAVVAGAAARRATRTALAVAVRMVNARPWGPCP